MSKKKQAACFLDTLREILVAAAETIDGVDVWTAGPLRNDTVTGFALEYRGKTYVIELFTEEPPAKKRRPKHD